MKRVFVLGAGASKAVNENSPLMYQLLTVRFLREHQSNPRVKEVKSFIEEFYNCPLDSDEGRLPSLENILSQLDAAIEDGEPTFSALFSNEQLQQLRRHLIYTICLVIRNRLQSPSNHDLIKGFMENLTPDDSLISLNYDLILDNALRREMGQTVNYGIPVRHSIKRDEKPQPYIAESPIKFYKLHGSLNWLYCPHCKALDIAEGPDNVVDIFDFGEELAQCQVCGHGGYHELLVTPTFFKDYTRNDTVYQSWRGAEAELMDADEIIFIGYSLPDADIALKSMFTRALYVNRKRHNRDYVVRVIDQVQPTPIHRRYESMFGKVDYDPDGFERYIQRGCLTDWQLTEQVQRTPHTSA